LTYTINAAPLQSGTGKKVNYILEVSITSEFVDNDVIIQWEYGGTIGGKVRPDANGVVLEQRRGRGRGGDWKGYRVRSISERVPLLTLSFPKGKRK